MLVQGLASPRREVAGDTIKEVRRKKHKYRCITQSVFSQYLACHSFRDLNFTEGWREVGKKGESLREEHESENGSRLENDPCLMQD